MHRFHPIRAIALIVVLVVASGCLSAWYMDALPTDTTIDGRCEICGKAMQYALEIRAGDEVIETHEYCSYHTYCLAFVKPLTVAPIALEAYATYNGGITSSSRYGGGDWREWDFYSRGQYLVFFNAYGLSSWLALFGAIIYLSRRRPAAVERTAG